MNASIPRMISAVAKGFLKFAVPTDTAEAPAIMNSIASSQIITFPSGEGYGTDLHFRMAVPPGDYSDLHIAIIDGDEVPIEGLERIAFGKASLSLQPADYLAMPALDIRSKCTRSSAVFHALQILLFPDFRSF